MRTLKSARVVPMRLVRSASMMVSSLGVWGNRRFSHVQKSWLYANKKPAVPSSEACTEWSPEKW